MVMDLQDVKTTLADGIASKQIRLLGSSSAPLTVGNSTREYDDEDDEEDDDDEDRLRQASLPVLIWLSGSANQFSGR